MNMWHRFLVWVGIRKPCNPRSFTKEQVAVGPLSEVAGHPAVFRDNPPERGPLDLPRPTARRVAPPPRYGGTPSNRRVRTPNANARSAVNNTSQPRHSESNDLLDGLTAFVLADALLSDVTTGAGTGSETSELANPGNQGVPDREGIEIDFPGPDVSKPMLMHGEYHNGSEPSLKFTPAIAEQRQASSDAHNERWGSVEHDFTSVPSSTTFDGGYSRNSSSSGGASESSWLGDTMSSVGDAVSSVFDD